MIRSLGIVTMLALAACAPAAPPAAAAAPESTGPRFHLVITETAPSNIGHEVIDADVESWPRDNLGPVLYASPTGTDQDCTPNVSVMFASTPAADARYAIGAQVQLFIEAQCGISGEVRSWRATAGTVTIASAADGYRVHISGAAMEPTGGDNHGSGTFVVEGMGSAITLHAS